MRRKRNKCLVICMLCCLSVFSQTEGYHFRADVVPVNETGFYNVLLTPQLKAHLKTDYSDLRLVNSSGKWVPHLLRTPGAERTLHSAWWDLSIVKNESNTNVSELIIGTGKQKVSNLKFTLRNTTVERFGILTGSEDSINWFIINDSIQLSPALADGSAESEFVINFPPSSYRFYKLEVSNKGKAPYAIRKVTSSYPMFQDGTNNSLWQPQLNPATIVTQKDSGKISYITVTQRGNFHTNRIQLNLGGSKYFNRLVELYLPARAKPSNKHPGHFVTSFTASDNSSLLFNVPLFNDSIFFLLIHNDDNLPLKINDVQTYSDLQVATVYLDKNTAYHVLMGNATATPPKYDLQIEDIELQKNLPLAATGSIRYVNRNESFTQSAWYKSKNMLWVVIFLAASILTFVTYRLIKEIGKTKDSLS